MNDGFISGFSVGEANTSSLNISHLLFADDTLVFCEASHDHIQALRALHLCFEVISGLKASLGKLDVVSVEQVQNVDSIASILACKILNLPMMF